MAGAGDVATAFTQDEPDDDFRPEESGAGGGAQGKAAAPGEAKEDSNDDTQMKDEDEDDSSPVSPLLVGAWQQLDGTAKDLAVVGGPGWQRLAVPRLLAWNHIGQVGSYPKQQRIEVHRTQEEKPQRIPDFDGLQMAALSAGACCLGAGSKATGGPRLLIRPAERWEKAEFSAPLSGDEAPEAIACGDGFVAALTSRRLLRLYTYSGMPIGLLSIPGRSVALAARGSLLLVVTRSPLAPAMPDDGTDDVLDFRLLDACSRMERAAGRLPLSPTSRLRWIGISEDLAPICIDTMGVVRALLGTGAGSWGSQNGSGGEWTPVLALAEHEADLGPLWAVHAQQGELVVAEAGLTAEEPSPCPTKEVASSQDLMNSQDHLSAPDGSPAASSAVPLRTLSWRVPLGAFPICGDFIEIAYREQLLARHACDVASATQPGSGEAARRADAAEKKGKSSALKLFAQLATAGEGERALHVAQFVLGGVSGSAKVLDMAQKLADKAGQLKLADEIEKLPRDSLSDRRLPTLEAARPNLPPLFRPGEFDGASQGSQGATPMTETSPTTPATVSACSSPAAELQDKQLSPAEGKESSPRASSVAAASSAKGSPAGSGSGSQLPAAAAAPGPAASPAGAAGGATAAGAGNPFARKRPLQAQARQSAPHLLRDALGGSGAATRQPPTPMGLSGGAGTAADSPASKAPRTAGPA